MIRGNIKIMSMSSLVTQACDLSRGIKMLGGH